MGRRKIRHSKCAVRKRWEDGKSVIQNVALGKGEEEENPLYEFWHFKKGLGRPKIRHTSCATRKGGVKSVKYVMRVVPQGNNVKTNLS